MITNTDVNRRDFKWWDFSIILTIVVFRLWERLNLLTLNSSMPTRAEKIEKLMSQRIPALIVTRGLQIFPEMIELAEKV